MSNPLQPKCIKVLQQDYKAYVINVIASSKNGNMDIVACINGLFWGFEIKWKQDKPSELQKQKLNDLNAAGGKGFFIRSILELRDAVEGRTPTINYNVTRKYII